MGRSCSRVTRGKGDEKRGQNQIGDGVPNTPAENSGEGGTSLKKRT